MSPSTRMVAATPLKSPPRWPRSNNDCNNAAAAFCRAQSRNSGNSLAGVGLSATAWNLGLTLANDTPTWMLQAGIAAIDRRLPLGEATNRLSERFADLGVENADGSFSDLFQIGLETV